MHASLTKPRATPAAGSLLAAIGNTPLLKLERMAEDLPGIEIYAKAEYSQAQGQHWRATVTGAAIAGHRDDFLGQYRRNSHVVAALRYSF